MGYLIILIILIFGSERFLEANEKMDSQMLEFIELTPLSQQEFTNFYEGFTAQYADTIFKTNTFKDLEEANTAAKAQMSAILPEGLATKGQYLLKIKRNQEDVGILWYAEKRAGPDNNEGTAWLRWIYVDPMFRRMGYAKAAVTKMEMHLKSLGIPCIGLNVFSTTPFAKDLYESLGYVVDKIVLNPDSKEIVRYELSKNL